MKSMDERYALIRKALTGGKKDAASGDHGCDR